MSLTNVQVMDDEKAVYMGKQPPITQCYTIWLREKQRGREEGKREESPPKSPSWTSPHLQNAWVIKGVSNTNKILEHRD